ncbi:MAG TPA: ATP-binding protein [Acidimicrobiales bacterium]|nr:ATP-binding protein [Acidimicrobiales bacterium]
MERGVLVGLAGLRWAAWIGLSAVALANLHRDQHPVVVILAIVATGGVTLAAQVVLVGPHWQSALSHALVGAEVTVAAVVVAADGWVHQGLATGQSLAGIWPLPAILLAAVAGGVVWGVGVATVLSAARFLAVFVAAPAGPAGRDLLGAFTTGASWVVFGAVCGIIIRLLRQTQHQLAQAEARDHIARDLHDGVLQTLALIERRSDSADIAQLARDQERDLRSYLFGDRSNAGTLRAQLDRAAARAERAWPGMAVTVTVTDDVPPVPPGLGEPVVGAATEALTNAAKHGHAARVVVFADVEEGSGSLFVSVKDDGSGFDPATVHEGVGMARSIRGRVEDVGGRVEFASEPGDGTEVRITMPVTARRRATRG